MRGDKRNEVSSRWWSSINCRFGTDGRLRRRREKIRDLPIDWQIPYLFPPPTQASISPESTVDAGPPPTRDLIPFVAPHFNYSSDLSAHVSKNADGFYPNHHVVTHRSSHPHISTIQSMPPRSSARNGVASESISIVSTDSLPSLESVESDMSVSSNEEIYGKWDQFRREIQEELSRERDQRIAEWTSFQHEMEQTRQRERDNRIVDRENLELFSKAANLLDPKRDANSSIHSTSA